MSFILSAMIFIPLIGILFLMTIRGDENRVLRNSRNIRLIITASELLLIPFMFGNFSTKISGFQFAVEKPWFGNFAYHVGIDGISALFLGAVILLFFLSTLTDRNAKIKMAREYTIFLLWLQSMVIGLLSSLDILLFGLFFAGISIPFFFLIGIWNKNDEKPVNLWLLLANSGAIALLVFGLIMMYLHLPSSSLEGINRLRLPPFTGELVFWSLSISFFSSMLLFPLSSCGKIRTEAPVTVTVSLLTIPILAGIFAFIRIILPAFPDFLAEYSGIIIALSSLFFLYFSVKAYIQNDLRDLFICFSGAVTGIIITGLFSGSALGISGSLYLLLNYFFVISGLCFCGEILYSRRKSYRLNDSGGLFSTMPVFSKLFFLFAAAVFCAPLSGGFAGLLMLIIGIFAHYPLVSLFLALGIFISAGYAVRAYQLLMLGKAPENEESFADLTLKETLILLFCLAIIVAMGIFTHWFIAFIFPTLNRMEGWS